MKFLPLVLTGVLLLASGFGRASEPHRRPNIIVVMADNIGYGDLSCLGNPIVRTPNMDRFYGESVRFTNFHVSPGPLRRRAAAFADRSA